MIIKNSPLYQSFQYDFAKTGGAIGNQNTGIQLPSGAQISFFQIFCLTALTSGGAATVSIGTTTSVALIFPATGFASFILNRWVTGLGITPLTAVMDATLNVTISIAAATLTAGKFNGYITYYLPQT